MSGRLDLTPQVMARLREAADLMTVVSEHVKLKRQGRRWVGVCPFHPDSDPSFSVNPERGLYHCFGCHASGDVIDFVMQHERLEFLEAVEYLARRFGVELRAARPAGDVRRPRIERARCSRMPRAGSSNACVLKTRRPFVSSSPSVAFRRSLGASSASATHRTAGESCSMGWRHATAPKRWWKQDWPSCPSVAGDHTTAFAQDHLSDPSRGRTPRGVRGPGPARGGAEVSEQP